LNQTHCNVFGKPESILLLYLRISEWLIFATMFFGLWNQYSYYRLYPFSNLIQISVQIQNHLSPILMTFLQCETPLIPLLLLLDVPRILLSYMLRLFVNHFIICFPCNCVMLPYSMAGKFIIVSVFKVGDHNSASNYCPIFMLHI